MKCKYCNKELDLIPWDDGMMMYTCLNAYYNGTNYTCPLIQRPQWYNRVAPPRDKTCGGMIAGVSSLEQDLKARKARINKYHGGR